MMIRLLIVSGMLLLSYQMNAQIQLPLLDYFMLKDSSQIIGRVLNYEQDEYWMLRNLEGEIKKIPVADILNIRQQSIKPYNPPRIKGAPTGIEALVILKDSTVFKGTLISYEYGGKTRLKIAKDIEIVFTSEEVQRVVQGIKLKEEEFEWLEQRMKLYEFKERGWYFVTSMATISGGNGGSALTGLSLNQSAGFRFNRLLGVGIGTGIDLYTFDGEERIIPFFAEVRGYLNKKYSAPYYTFAAGYGHPLLNKTLFVTKTTGGIMLHPAVGIRLGGRKDANFLFDVGYRFQKATIIREIDVVEEKFVKRVFYKRLSLRLGVIF